MSAGCEVDVDESEPLGYFSKRDVSRWDLRNLGGADLLGFDWRESATCMP